MSAERVEGPGILAAGTRLGRYQIMRRLAVGGMAELYLARQLGDAGYEKVVALKRVLPHLAEEENFVEMFLNEARLAAGLDHSGIAHVLDFGTEAGEHFMALEYVHGRSVLQMLREAAGHGGVPRDVALTIVHEVAGALHYAHERRGANGKPLGLVHRDVSPSNVLASFDGDVKLVDFGIAKATAHTRATQTAAIKGKIAYMAPEQVRGEPVDRRSDVFALSVVLYELCLGRRCFSAPGEFALINRVAEARYARPSTIDPDFPPRLEEIIVRGLSVDSEDRPATARELQVALEDFAQQAGLRVSKVTLARFMEQLFGFEAYPRTDSLPAAALVPDVVAEPVPLDMGSRRTPWMWISGALVAGLLLGVGVPLLLRDRDGPAPAGTETRGEQLEDSASRAASPAAAATPSPHETSPAGPLRPLADEDLVVIEDDPEPPAAPPKKPGRRPSKRKRSKKRPPSPGAGQEYLPPSRRPG